MTPTPARSAELAAEDSVVATISDAKIDRDAMVETVLRTLH